MIRRVIGKKLRVRKRTSLKTIRRTIMRTITKISTTRRKTQVPFSKIHVAGEDRVTQAVKTAVAVECKEVVAVIVITSTKVKSSATTAEARDTCLVNAPKSRGNANPRGILPLHAIIATRKAISPVTVPKSRGAANPRGDLLPAIIATKKAISPVTAPKNRGNADPRGELTLPAINATRKAISPATALMEMEMEKEKRGNK